MKISFIVGVAILVAPHWLDTISLGQDVTVETIRFLRPEDQGEDFTPLSNSEVLKHLLTSPEEAVQMKSAKVLGNRAIDGSFTPTPEEQKDIDDYIAEKILSVFKSDNPGDSGNARDQLARLWHLAVPSLLEAAKNQDRDIAFNALDTLLQIRSEAVVRGLISLYENNDDKSIREKSIRSFSMITAIHDPRLPYRPLPDPAETKTICDTLVTPFLANIIKTEKDTDLSEIIKEAQTRLASEPIDSRAKIVRIEKSPIDSRTQKVVAEQNVIEELISPKDNIPVPAAPSSVDASLEDKKPDDTIVEQNIERQKSILVPVVAVLIILALLAGGAFIAVSRPKPPICRRREKDPTAQQT